MPPHYPTPVKAQIRGTAAYLNAHHILYFKTDLFTYFNIHKRQGWAILNSDTDRRYLEYKKRERKSIITLTNLRQMEEIL